ncbi:phenylacetate-CoA oxygenase subunit PaaC [Rhodobacterales bacterium HKCCE3408]|nr:phenylacetate-CoA oxygenase subunit PaaC [Rhodobacterales bacterium HKCCE3408]
MDETLFDFLLRMGDSTLILGHRISEWCGHAPVLEEDIALANTALDLIGQTQMWLGLAGEIEGKGRSADDLAFLRDAWDFRNALLVELPNGDFGRTILRQFLFDAWHKPMLKALAGSDNERVAEIAAKAVKEVDYHLERSANTVVALGDGTDESHRRMQDALDALWPYAGELRTIAGPDGVIPDGVADAHSAMMREVLSEATLKIPEGEFAHKGGVSGQMHTEHLGHLLTTMQWLQRAYPGATW